MTILEIIINSNYKTDTNPELCLQHSRAIHNRGKPRSLPPRSGRALPHTWGTSQHLSLCSAGPGQMLLFCLSQTGSAQSDFGVCKGNVSSRSLGSVRQHHREAEHRGWFTPSCGVRTHGCAIKMGRAFAWIFDGLLKPMVYTPRKSSFFL